MTFKEALDLMQKGKKVKLPGWDGYWEWFADNETILIHTGEGTVLDIRSTERVLSTMLATTKDDWEIADSTNCFLLGGDSSFNFAKALEFLDKGFKVYRKEWMSTSEFAFFIEKTIVEEFSNPIIQFVSIKRNDFGTSKAPWVPTQFDLFAVDWELFKELF